MPNFSSLACLEVPEKFLWGGWVGVVGWGLHSHYVVKPNLVLRLGWGSDKNRFKSVLSVREGLRLTLSGYMCYVSTII